MKKTYLLLLFFLFLFVLILLVFYRTEYRYQMMVFDNVGTHMNGLPVTQSVDELSQQYDLFLPTCNCYMCQGSTWSWREEAGLAELCRMRKSFFSYRLGVLFPPGLHPPYYMKHDEDFIMNHDFGSHLKAGTYFITEDWQSSYKNQHILDMFVEIKEQHIKVAMPLPSNFSGCFFKVYHITAEDAERLKMNHSLSEQLIKNSPCVYDFNSSPHKYLTLPLGCYLFYLDENDPTVSSLEFMPCRGVKWFVLSVIED